VLQSTDMRWDTRTATRRDRWKSVHMTRTVTAISSSKVVHENFSLIDLTQLRRSGDAEEG